MKKLLIAAMFVFIAFTAVIAQNEGTFVDETSVTDSSYVEDGIFIMEDEVEESGNSMTAILIGVGVVVIGGIAFFVLKKKK